MKRLLLAFSLFLITPASAAEITSKITDSVQLKVDAAASQALRIGASYSASGSGIQFSGQNNSLGLAAGGAYGDATPTLVTAGNAFTFSESFNAADAVPGSVTTGAIAPYGNITSTAAGTPGALAGILASFPTAPLITAGGPGTSATAQRTVELSVFK
jgi:hypothetical protein